MSRIEAEAVDAAVEVLCEAGVDYVIARGGKHLSISVGGHKMMISGTPRTDNHKQWAKQGARALIVKTSEDKELRAPRARRDEREAACERRTRNVASQVLTGRAA